MEPKIQKPMSKAFEIRLAIIGIRALLPATISYCSGEMDREFKRKKKYKRISKKRKVERKEWQAHKLATALIGGFKKAMSFTIDTYAKPEDRKALKKIYC